MSQRALDGKVAIVTGAGSPIGLGRAMALALVQAGARVAMLDVDADIEVVRAACTAARTEDGRRAFASARVLAVAQGAEIRRTIEGLTAGT